MNKRKEELKALLHDIGVMCKCPCTNDENTQYTLLLNHKQKLPEGIYQYNQEDRFYRLVKDDTAETDLDMYIWMRQIKILNTIKYCLIFLSLIITAYIGVILLT